MLSTLARRLVRAMRSDGLLAPGDRVAVAVSGGSDSVALLLLLAELAQNADWTLAGVVHVTHGLRPDEAATDVAFCRTLTSRLALRLDVVEVDTRRHMAEAHLSLEAAARMLRYRAFEEAADRLGATVVATGHTADDQAETVLLRLVNGASLRGASAIRAKRGRYRRPLLGVRREALCAYLRGRGEAFRDDASNRDESIPRNRLRHTVMPAVDRFAPNAALAIARFASISSDDHAFLAARAERAAARIVRIAADGVELDRGPLVALPAALARRVVVAAIEQAGGRASFHGVKAVLALARSEQVRGHRDVSGLKVESSRSNVWLSRATVASGVLTVEGHELPVPGEVRVDATGSVLRARRLDGEVPAAYRVSAGPTVAVQADGLALPLQVRGRRAGDRFRPLGAPGVRKLQDVFVDRKIPLTERDGVPIVVDGNGEIVWVAGVAVAEGVRARAPEKGVVILEFEKGRP